jgi:hypothetical protein
MNQKTSKFLRKAAKELFSKLENPTARDLIEDESKRKYYRQLMQDSDGNPVINERGELQFSVIGASRGQMTNSQTSLRGIYRNMKRDHKACIA